MTVFECICKKLDVKITIDKRGCYDGMSGAVANICHDIIDDDSDVSFENVSKRFYKIFPYKK